MSLTTQRGKAFLRAGADDRYGRLPRAYSRAGAGLVIRRRGHLATKARSRLRVDPSASRIVGALITSASRGGSHACATAQVSSGRPNRSRGRICTGRAAPALPRRRPRPDSAKSRRRSCQRRSPVRAGTRRAESCRAAAVDEAAAKARSAAPARRMGTIGLAHSEDDCCGERSGLRVHAPAAHIAANSLHGAAKARPQNKSCGVALQILTS